MEIVLQWWEFILLVSFAVSFGYVVAALMAGSGQSAREDLYEEGILVRDLEIKELRERLGEK